MYIYYIRHMVSLFCQALSVSGAASPPSALSGSLLTSHCPNPPISFAGWSYNFLSVTLRKPCLAPLSRPFLVHNARHLFFVLLVSPDSTDDLIPNDYLYWITPTPASPKLRHALLYFYIPLGFWPALSLWLSSCMHYSSILLWYRSLIWGNL